MDCHMLICKVNKADELWVAKRYVLAPAVESDLLEQATNRATNTSVLYTRILKQIRK